MCVRLTHRRSVHDYKMEFMVEIEFSSYTDTHNSTANSFVVVSLLFDLFFVKAIHPERTEY